MEIGLEKVSIFMGDGKAYDARRQPGDLVRLGSILYQEVVTELLAEVEQTSVIADTIG
jgi:hypothetical protein